MPVAELMNAVRNVFHDDGKKRKHIQVLGASTSEQGIIGVDPPDHRLRTEYQKQHKETFSESERSSRG